MPGLRNVTSEVMRASHTFRTGKASGSSWVWCRTIAYPVRELQTRPSSTHLVVHRYWIDGYKDLSLIRAPAVVKRQFTRMPSSLRRCCHAFVSCSRVS